MTEIEKLPLTSLDIKTHQLERLKEIFPEAFTEGSKVDWDKLRLTLGEAVDTGKERFGMNWPGKGECFKTIQQPSIATLVPAREESVDFDTTQNLFIEGDNLEVLKLLQKSYLGRVKMIYIDPPYNKGKDFIYPDNYSESLDTYLAYTGQVDAEGKKFSTNTETDGRFHSKWMNMMYPRLFLARNLLKEDGVIFISIDDKEVQNLRAICNEVFGEENFVACLSTIMNLKGNHDTYGFSDTHEYTLVYVKRKEVFSFGHFDINEDELEDWEEDEYGLFKRADTLRRTGQDASRVKRPKGWFPVFITPKNEIYVTGNDEPVSSNDTILWPINDDGEELSWTWSKDKIRKESYNLFVVTGRNGKNIYKKQRPQLGDLPTKKPKTLFYKAEYSTSTATTELKKLLGKKLFDTPKPVPFISDLITIGTEKNDIVLDFFAGSCSTAHAVIELNKEKETNRKFICIQLPEKTKEDEDAFKEGFLTIADIGKERIRRVISKIKKEQKDNKNLFSEGQSTQDLGFKVFKLTKSNFNIWDAGVEKTPEAIQQQLQFHIDHISPEAEQEAILYELLLKSGFEVTTAIEQLDIEGKKVFSIAEGELLICLEKQLSHEVIKAMAERKPTRVICLDEGFQNNDQLKTNAVQIMKSKSVVNFRTV